MKMSSITMLLVVVLLVAMSPARACIVRHMTYAQALALTDATVIGEIIQILPPSEGHLARSFNFRVRLLESERGSLKADTLIDVELLLHLARRTKDSTQCPLQRGSGLEDEFHVGGRYRMLVQREGDHYELFWSEEQVTKS